MSAATFEQIGIQGAPRSGVDDAWRTLNLRYAGGTVGLIAVLALLWAVGMGPGAGGTAPPALPGAGVTGSAAGGASPATRMSSTVETVPGPLGPEPSGGGAAQIGAITPSAAAPIGDRPGNGAASNGTVVRLYFEPNQSRPSGEVGARLAPVLAQLAAEPDARAVVSGWHDRRGPSAERNAALAQRRAQSVRRILIQAGLSADRILVRTAARPQGDGPDREARRVEVTVAR